MHVKDVIKEEDIARYLLRGNCKSANNTNHQRRAKIKYSRTLNLMERYRV
jgi:hypothetical protein